MPTKTIEVTELALAIEQKLSEPGVTLRSAADAIGASPTTIMNWSAGKPIMFSLERQCAIAAFLGIEPPRVLELAGLQVAVTSHGPDDDTGVTTGGDNAPYRIFAPPADELVA